MGWAGIGAENRAREDLYLKPPRRETHTRSLAASLMQSTDHFYTVRHCAINFVSRLGK